MHTLQRVALATALALTASAQAAHHEGMDNKAVAKGWVEAACGDLEGLIAYVEKHMADDGVFIPERYVGLGFTIDGTDRDALPKVQMVTPGTPAAEVLREGDTFVSVNGVSAEWENRDNLNFRGEPGQPVSAVIMRDGKKMDIEVKRGVIATKNDKARVLRGLSMSDAETWPADSCTIHEAVQEGNVVYVSNSQRDTEDDTGIEWEQHNVSRYEFNDDGKIVKVWVRGESRFVLEQLGYTISR